LYIADDFHQEAEFLSNMGVDDNNVVWFPAAKSEPKTIQVDKIRDYIMAGRGSVPDVIVGVGGGSTLDVAKAISIILTNGGSAADYQGWDLVKKKGVFKIGVPTISGSGAEASRTAVLTGPDRKQGINSDYSMFDGIVLDSTLIASVPSAQRFYTGMDCYIHCVESLEGTMINELTRSYATTALTYCSEYFSGTCPEDERLMTASYLGGVSVVNSEVGLCHALSYGLSFVLGYSHGIANCIAFNVLDEFYGKWVLEYREFLAKHNIVLPQAVCSQCSEDEIGAMIEMTLRMERPLENALGREWREVMTKDRIRDFYLGM